MTAPSLQSDPLDKIFADYRVLYRHALENNHVHSRLSTLRLDVYKRIALAFSDAEMRKNTHLIRAYLERVEREVRLDLDRGEEEHTIDWRDVLKHAVEVADDLGWHVNFRYNPTSERIDVTVDDEQRRIVAHTFSDFQEQLRSRIGDGLMGVIQFGIRQNRNGQVSKAPDPQTAASRSR